jgi:hypothetical protein
MPTSAPDLRLSFVADRLHASLDGAAPQPARLAWLRPLTGRGRDLSVIDAKGAEIALLPGLDGLDTASRAAAERELESRYGEPRIRAIRSLWMVDGNRYVEADTDRGVRTFILRHLERELVWQPDGSALIKDPAGNRFLLPRLADLDAASRARLAAAL